MIAIYLAIGFLSGIAAGIFGIGGGVLIVPALYYFAGFGHEKAVGTSLAILLPPVGIAAAWEYYRHGNVDVKAAAYVAVGLLIGAWIGAYATHRSPEVWLRFAFGVFVTLVGLFVAVDSLRRI